MDYKAIETHYNGYRFRSRLEARWAVFFDRVGIEYEYEPQGFLVGDKPYLPDFFLTGIGAWVEVKGAEEKMDDGYVRLLAEAVDYGGALPGVADSHGTQRGLIVLGPIPNLDAQFAAPSTPAHCILQHSKGGWLEWFSFSGGESIAVTCDGDNYFDSLWDEQSSLSIAIKESISNKRTWPLRPCSARVRAGYIAARKSRFEHGECGAVRR